MNIEYVIEWGLQTGLAVGILVALIVIIRRPFSKVFGPKATYMLWALPALRLVMPPVELAWLAPIQAALPDTAQTFLPVDFLYTAQPAPGGNAIMSFWDNHGLMMLAVLWAMGVIGFWIWQTHTQKKTVKYWLTDRENPSPRLLQDSADLASVMGLKAAPKLSLSPHISGPLVTGLRRAYIILPIDFETALTPQEQYYALLHEMVHLKRKDLYASALFLVIRAINWPNPLIHIAARYFRADQEAACDAAVIGYERLGQKKELNISQTYAQTLMKVALLAQAKHKDNPARAVHAVPALALTIHHPLKERLMTLSHSRPQLSLRHRLAGTAIITTLFALTAPISFVHAAPQTELAGQATPPATPTPPHIEIDKDIRIIRDGKQTHVIQSRSDQNGVIQDRKVEINVDGEDITAFEIDPRSGTKTQINPKTIEGYEHITQSHGRFKIDNANGQIIRFEVQEDDSDVEAIIERLKAEGKLDSGSASGRVKVLRLNEDGDENVWISEDGEERHIKTGAFTFTIDDDDFPEGVNLEDILKDQEIDGQVIKSLKVLGDQDVRVIFSDSDVSGLSTQSRLLAVEGMLEAAQSMLKESGEANRELKKATKELEEAMKALEKAQDRLGAADK